ncbi:MAG: histidinol-phosphate transaminase [Thermoleophilia bacterium]
MIRHNRALEHLAPYKAGPPLEQIREEYGLERVVKLASNESPEEPFPEVLEAIARAAAGANRYPDGAWRDLRGALADVWGVDRSDVILGNGSCDLLLLLGQALLMPGTKLVYGWPSFVIYRTMAEASLAEPVEVGLRDHRHDLSAMLEAVDERTHMIIVCNPNNPTGSYLPSAEIRAFLEAVPPEIAVVLDEAYVEFVHCEHTDTTSWITEFPNLVILRTFSKIYGLAGLRVGYALTRGFLVDALNKVRQPFNLNTLAQAAATEALRHPERVRQRREFTWRERERLARELTNLGMPPAPSEANFLLFPIAPMSVPPEEAAQALLERGVVVRSGYALGHPGWLRVTIGTTEENDFFLETLRGLLRQEPAGAHERGKRA